MFEATDNGALWVAGQPCNCEHLALPKAGYLVVPFIHDVRVQMISYFASLAEGTGVDQLKNLIKSVTVEL